MVQIALLLFGTRFTRKKALPLALIALLWLVLGVVIIIDGLDGVRYFPLRTFGALLLIESMVTLFMASSASGAQRAIFTFKGGIFCFVALMILCGRSTSDMLLAIFFGFSYFITAILMMLAAWVVRFERWKQTFIGGIGRFAFAVFLVTPWPTHYHDTLSLFIGMTLILGGINTLNIALSLRHLQQGSSIFQLFAPVSLLKNVARRRPGKVFDARDMGAQGQGLTVHIWTPEGTSANPALPRPVINRYIAAVDSNGVISTGHAALEMTPDLYISLYPATEIDRSPGEFFNILKATQENNVPGVFQPSYRHEAEEWCESTRKIIFSRYNEASLRHFWEHYRQDEIYNLTWRNCSSSVAFALEAAMDGVLASRHHDWLAFIRLFFMPELWIAAQLRRRATTMAWTPGLVADYARAIRALVHLAGMRLKQEQKAAEG